MMTAALKRTYTKSKQGMGSKDFSKNGNNTVIEGYFTPPPEVMANKTLRETANKSA